MAEWVINYQGGFTRRGFLGEVVFQISQKFNFQLRKSFLILQILIYAGIPGLIFFFLFLFRIFKASYITYKNTGILLPALLASPLLGYFMLTQSISEKIVWIMMAYIVGNYLVNNLKISPNKGI